MKQPAAAVRIPRASRAPNGCNARPIQITLRPEERAHIEQLAAAEQRSMASVCRLLIMRGMEATDTKTSSLVG